MLLRQARRVVVAVVGGTVLLIGVAMLVLPGPALVVIPTGLAILGLEFAWARRWLERVRQQARQAVGRWSRPGAGDRGAARTDEESGSGGPRAR